MTLRELLDHKPSAIAHDSRHVKPGAIFAALRGVHADGARFVPQAIANGAAAVMAESAPPRLRRPVAARA
jgi:UDP-N-acetylmuramoyl-L-alanyl-D-glutamate--2,6-diaminopimelate ligase